jgi:anthranilate phosphoribosyltransferase
VEEAGIGFFFAPAFHGALRHAAPVRRRLGVRTFFNLLGPLANPAGATHQLVGVYDPARVRQLAEVLALLGVEAAWVVHGEGGLDEVSPCGPTAVARLVRGQVTSGTLTPDDFGIAPVDRAALAGGSPADNAALARRLLDGERAPVRSAVIVNAAAALVVAGATGDLRDAAARAADALDSGAARTTLDRLIAIGSAP